MSRKEIIIFSLFVSALIMLVVILSVFEGKNDHLYDELNQLNLSSVERFEGNSNWVKMISGLSELMSLYVSSGSSQYQESFIKEAELFQIDQYKPIFSTSNSSELSLGNLYDNALFYLGNLVRLEMEVVSLQGNGNHDRAVAKMSSADFLDAKQALGQAIEQLNSQIKIQSNQNELKINQEIASNKNTLFLFRVIFVAGVLMLIAWYFFIVYSNQEKTKRIRMREHNLDQMYYRLKTGEWKYNKSSEVITLSKHIVDLIGMPTNGKGDQDMDIYSLLSRIHKSEATYLKLWLDASHYDSNFCQFTLRYQARSFIFRAYKDVAYKTAIEQNEVEGILQDYTMEAKKQSVYESLLDNASNGLVQLGRRYELLYANPKVVSWFDDKYFVEGEKCYRKLYGRLNPCANCRMGEVLIGKSDVVIENQQLNGRIILEQLSPIYDEDQKISGIVMNVTDISEIKRSELELKQKIDQVNITSKISGLGFWKYDVVEDLFTGDESWYEIKGINQEIKGVNLAFVLGKLNEEDRIKFKEALERHLNNETPVMKCEYRLYNDKSEEWLDISTMGRVREYGDGKYRFVIGVIQNVTEKKNSERRLLQFEKMAVLGKLIAGIAHEINTPLGIISSTIHNQMHQNEQLFEKTGLIFQSVDDGCIEVMSQLIRRSQQTEFLASSILRQRRNELEKALEPYEDIDQRTSARILSKMGIFELNEDILLLLKQKNVDTILEVVQSWFNLTANATIINQSVERMSHVISALKSYIRTEQEGVMKPINVENSIETVLMLYKNKLKMNYEINKHYASVSLIEANEDEVTQIWINTLDNAIYAMGTKGRIDIETREMEGYVCVSIRDNGEGMDENTKKHIFEPFFTTKPHGIGSGIGMDIVWNIMNRHSGYIEVESEVGFGTTMKFFFPIKNAQPRGSGIRL